MSNHMNVSILLATMLLSAGANNCDGGKCNVDDETSLMQYQSAVKPGQSRVVYSNEKPAESNEPQEPAESNEPDQQPAELENVDSNLGHLSAEKFTLTGPTLAPGCHDQGCYGSGPSCGGNSFDCTSKGFVVTGWYKSCSHFDTCESGWKVRCAKCDDNTKAKPAPMPAPAPQPALWTEPAPGPTPKPAPTPAPASAPVLPTNAPIYTAPKYDENATKHAKHDLKLAHSNVTLFKQALANASSIEHKVHKNITEFEAKEAHARTEFHEARDAAVHYAKKVELANITVMRANKAMANAYFAEKGAEQQAQNSLADAKNANAEKRYYEKKLVDARHKTTEAMEAVHVGEVAVEKAMSDLAIAKRFETATHYHDHHENDRKLYYAHHGEHLAMDYAVQKAKVDAFVESSVGRNDSNVPPFDGP